MSKAIEVRWKQGEFAGYTDVFPVDEFKTDVTAAERVHLIRGPAGGRYTARYSLTVRGLTARLDYTAFPHFNENRGIVLGIMEFRFTDAMRQKVSQLRWDGSLVAPPEASVSTVVAESISDAVTSQNRAFAKQLMRPGQAKFRHALDVTYGGRCCVTGCDVPWALQAAHILPYKDKQSNAASNGLLLRGDLHALFDSDRLAVHPTSRIVYFAPDAQSWPEYADLHGVQKLRAPQPGYQGSGPRDRDLEARWKAYVRTHGDPTSPA